MEELYWKVVSSCVLFLRLTKLCPKPNSANVWRNRGELAEGWYDPSTLRQATSSSQPQRHTTIKNRTPSIVREEKSESDDDELGPLLPGELLEQRGRWARAGPAIPSIQDLELKRGN